MKEQLYGTFVNPGPAYRGKPFWSWNGELDREELLRQIDVFEQMGFGGFFMHARTGLITEYLGEEWFELTRICAEEAQRRGMEAWLYDEDRWPSGTAGGKVTAEPRFRMKFVKMRIVAEPFCPWRETWIAAFECRLEDGAYYDGRRLTPGEDAAPRPGYVTLSFEIEEMAPESFYNGQTYVDTMNREATEAFITVTHAQYKARMGELFGNAITGIFTDEPHRGPLMTNFNVANADPQHMLPWTYDLFERFEAKFGYDLRDRLPEVFFRPEGRSVSQVKWHIVDLLQELFLDNYVKPLDEWCRANKLILTGHLLHEDSLSAQTAMVGSVMRCYEHMEYPGIDVLTEGNRCFWVAKQLSSVARQIGRKWLMSELYGCTGWQMPLEAHKAVGNWQTLLGINLRCHHLSWYTMEGESKRDYPASISYQSAWWRDYQVVETYFARLGAVMTHGEPVCDLLVIHPVESVWCQVHAGWADTLAGNTAEIRRLETDFANVFNWLSCARIDFDYGDEEMLQRLSAVERDAAGRAVFRVGNAVYGTVLVAGLTTIRASTLRQLALFRQAGGVVVFAGEAPGYVDAVPSEDGGTLAAGSVRVPLDEAGIAAVGTHLAGGRIAAVDASGEPIADLYAQVRRDETHTYVVLLNVNRETAYAGVRLRLPYQGHVEEWNCETGERIATDATSLDGAIELTADFAAAGEKVYVFGGAPPEAPTVRPVLQTVAAYEWEGDFAYSLDEPNVCVLDRASYKLDGGEWRETLEILKLDRAVRRELGYAYRSGDMVQPWYAIQTRAGTARQTHRLTLRYSFDVDEAVASGGADGWHLAVERPGQKRIRLNGRKLAGGDAGWWVDPVFRKLDIPPAGLQPGLNQIEIEVDFDASVDLEAIYLLGPFGVRVQGADKTVCALPERLAIGDLAPQGLPFYGGTVTYAFEWGAYAEQAKRHLDSVPDAAVQLEVPAYEGGCLRAGNRTAGSVTIPWRPNVADVAGIVGADEPLLLDVVLTRRNTFGPLHMEPLYSAAYGPGHWLTEGDAFSEAYKLVPSGLTQPPRLLLRAPAP
ncbi:hypothetical protein [Cohnella hashimotonis]|uniref:Glycoside hydrolase n=1 Tax=Cohnella hashimotonis TaxID=2826895 RepID=A0ABT6TQ97_9BACL|nr:hypothetical protein [Cohnella hashimotonis]MDI4649020.1 hypothetical protein [Cohnella hashimotonis]